MAYVRSEVVGFLNKYMDYVGEETIIRSQYEQTRLVQNLRKRFPDLTKSDLEEVFGFCRSETAAQREEKRKTDQLHAMAAFLERHQILDETSWIDAVRMVAGRGDAEAQVILADLESPAETISRALFEAAVEAHPAWCHEGRHFVFDADIGGPEDDVSLIDWFQRTHPREASAITKRVLSAP